jgi:hypothetical protein
MHEDAIERLDRAALTLLRALDRYSAELLPYLDEGSLLTLRREVENLRRALLGVQMGPLYWDIPAEVVDEVLDEALHAGPFLVSDAAQRVSEKLKESRE